MPNPRLVYLLVVGLLCLTPRVAAAQERLNFAYISPNAGSASVLWIAKDAGIFKKHGLDVNVIYIEGTPKALMSLFAGELQILAGTGPGGSERQGARGGRFDDHGLRGFSTLLPRCSPDDQKYANKKILYPHSGVISSQKLLREKRDAMMRFARASIEAIHFFKTNKPQTIAILKKYSKSDLATLDSAHTYLKNSIPDLPIPHWRE